MRKIQLLFMFLLFTNICAQAKTDKKKQSEAKLKEEINEIINEIKKQETKNSDQRDKWDKYIEKIRKSAKNQPTTVENFNKDATFYITLQRTTFIRKRGGFEHTPMCIVVPVNKKYILVGDQLCTIPSMKRLVMVKEFASDLNKEITQLKEAIALQEKELEKSKEEQKQLVELLAKVMESLPEYENDNYKKDEFNKLNSLINLYKKQIREINKKIKTEQDKLDLLKSREKYLLITNDFLDKQLIFYGLKENAEENIKISPLTEKLKELNKLRKEGLINQKDFDNAKERLLKKIN